MQRFRKPFGWYITSDYWKLYSYAIPVRVSGIRRARLPGVSKAQCSLHRGCRRRPRRPYGFLFLFFDSQFPFKPFRINRVEKPWVANQAVLKSKELTVTISAFA